MKGFFGLLLLLAMIKDNVATCTGSDADRVYYCKTFQKDYSEGTKTLIFEERDVGLINYTVFSSPNLKSVVTLTLTGSRIHTIEPRAFEHLSSLVNLELQNNRLTTISSSWFHEPIVLEQLNMAGNMIRQLHPGMLEGYSSLKVLNLSRNEIMKIDSESFSTLGKLSSLDLSYNKISSLERKLLMSLNVTLRLHGNPWNCSCGQKDFILFLKELVNASRVNDSNLITCRYPSELNGAVVWNLTDVNCSTTLSPSSATAFHQIVLPALFVVLAIFLFILLVFLTWKKKQDQKQVRPDKRTEGEEAVDTGRTAGTSADLVLVTSSMFGKMIFRSLPKQERTTMGRAKSASAILYQGSLSQAKTKEDATKLDKLPQSKNPKVKKNLVGPDELSEWNTELWYYNSLQSASVCKSPKAESMVSSEALHGIRKHSVKVHSSSDAASSNTGVVVLRQPQQEDGSTTSVIMSDVQEPLVYLCVKAAPEESVVANPLKKETSNNLAKPRLLKRTFTWPNERIQLKEETGDSYLKFLKTLNVSPKPGQSNSEIHVDKKTQPQKSDHDNSKFTFYTGTDNVLPKDKTVRPGRPTEKGNQREPKNLGGQRHSYSPSKVNQKSSHGKRAPANKVSLDCEVQREDINDQESNTRSDRRRTPDDNKLLENNEYQFIDLLHEVVENHGRWTRERWRQAHHRSSGGLFFSLSMWMIVCFLRSQCKNKVTNMADSKCNLTSSMERERNQKISPDDHDRIFENDLQDTVENISVRPFHVFNLNKRENGNPENISEPIRQLLRCEIHRTESELDEFVNSGLGAEKCKREGISKCPSAPLFLSCASNSSKGTEEHMCGITNVYQYATVSSDPAHTTQERCTPTYPTTTNVYSDLTEFPLPNTTKLQEAKLSCDMTGVFSINTSHISPAEECFSLGVEFTTNADNNEKPPEKSCEDSNHETDLVRYFETHFELMGTRRNDGFTFEDGTTKGDNQHKNLKTAKAFGKKSKTWTSFYDSADHLVQFEPEAEQELQKPIGAQNGSKMDRKEETDFRKEGHGECLNIASIKQGKCIASDDQRQRKSKNHHSGPDIGNKQPEMSQIGQRQRPKAEQHQSLPHVQMVRERLWKHHTNCCDEYQPCQTAAKALKQIKVLEKSHLAQKTEQSPPSDQDLLEENPSLPLIPSTFLEDQQDPTKPAICSKMTCSSLPNLSQYDRPQGCASSDAPSLQSPIQAFDNTGDNTILVNTSSAGHLDLSGICVVHGEHSPYIINLTESLEGSKKGLNNISSSAPALPSNNAPEMPSVGKIGYNLVSNSAQPIIISEIRSKNVISLSASQFELPTIHSGSLCGAAVHKTGLDNMTSNACLPDFHKMDLVRSLPAIKLLEGGGDVTVSQSVEPDISCDTIITITDTGMDGKPSLENQNLPLNLDIKTQTSVSAIQGNTADIGSSASYTLVGTSFINGEVMIGENESTHIQEPSKHIEYSNMSLNAETHMTNSISYSNSIQDGDDLSDWPNIADLVKHSSTISLSSNFDILNHLLVPQLNPTQENLHDTLNKSNPDLSVDRCDREETMDKQFVDKNMAVEGLPFHCDVQQQYNMGNKDSSCRMGNETFYIQDGTNLCSGNLSEDKVIDDRCIVIDHTHKNACFLECNDSVQIQMENKGKTDNISQSVDLHLISDNTMDSASHGESTQSNLDRVGDSRLEFQTQNEDVPRDQTEDEHANDQSVNHNGHSLTMACNGIGSEPDRREDVSWDSHSPPDEKREAEGSSSQTNIRNGNNDLGTAVLTHEAVDFEGYQKLNERVNSNVSRAENSIISNTLQEFLHSDSDICTSAQSRGIDTPSAETSSDGFRTTSDQKDCSKSKYSLEENDSTIMGSEVSGDALKCYSDVILNSGQESRLGAMEESLRNTEIPLEANQQSSAIQRIQETHNKQTWSNQKPKRNKQCKIPNKASPANAKDISELRDHLSSRVLRRSFYSVFPFTTKKSATVVDATPKTSTSEEEKPSASDSDTTSPPLVLSDHTNRSMDYLAYLYARSPKPKPCPGVHGVSDTDDISVLANLNFCKVRLLGDVVKQDVSTAVQEDFVEPAVEAADLQHVYLPPSKEELKADDELAVLHVICTLKKSLGLSSSNETESDCK